MHVPPRETRADHIEELGGWDAMLDLIEKQVPGAIAFREEMTARRFPAAGAGVSTDGEPGGGE